jgi:hypothetical protein
MLVCISQVGLEPASSGMGRSWILNVTRRSYMLAGGWGVGVLLLLGGFFLPNAALASQQGFWFMEFTLTASYL